MTTRAHRLPAVSEAGWQHEVLRACEYCGGSFTPSVGTPMQRFCGRRCQSTAAGCAKTTEPAEARFWRKADRRCVDECWEWRGRLNKGGYGSLYVGTRGDTHRMQLAHRFSYELHKGPIPDGLYVCHSCDNRRCVNPAHLWLGTHLDNARDAVSKGRIRVGERAGSSKLSDAKVREMRRLALGGASTRRIAREFGVAHNTARCAINGKTWRHVGPS